MSETVDITVDERGVAWLTLNRPDKHNAMNAEMIGALTKAAGRLGRDPAVRVVVLTGAGASFSAGGDLAWMRAQMEADAATRAREARSLAEMLGALDRLPKPLIGRVQGQAFGGGVGLVSVCDVAVAVEGARFGLTEVRLGLIPATIAPYVVARMGAARARAVFFSGRIFPAEEAVALGLVSRVVEAAALDAAVEAEIAPYLSAAPGARPRSRGASRRSWPGGRAPSATRASPPSSSAARPPGWGDPRASFRADACDYSYE